MRLFICLLIAASTSLQAQELQPWPGNVSRTLWDQVIRAGDSLSQALFDQFEEIKLGQHNFGNTAAEVAIGRTLFDNQDLLNTYTVTDHIRVSLAHTLWSPTLPSSFGFQLGVGGELKVTNVRQVAASRAAELPAPTELRDEITGGIIIPRDPAHSWYRRNPQLRPTFYQLWNMATQPLKIPLKVEHLRKLENGELIAWSVSGYVSAGPSWNLVPMQSIPTQISVGAQIFLKGEYRISVLKENERYVRLKLTRMRAQGISVGAGVDSSTEILEGMVVLGQELPGVPVRVIPFKFNWTWQTTRQNDIAFRYDLEDPHAVLAFEKAILGQLELSSEAESGVTKILTRSSIERQRLRERAMGLSFLFTSNRSRDIRSLVAWVRTEEGDHQVFKESVQLTREWKGWIKGRESRNHMFTVALAKRLSKEAPRFVLSAESTIEDRRTDAQEIFNYVGQVEAVVGDPNAIPDIPMAHPRPDGSFVIAKFGISSFHYGKHLDADQVDRFVRTPVTKIREYLKQAFPDASLGQMIKQAIFLKRFRETQTLFENNADPILRMRSLRKMFEMEKMGDGLLRVIALALQGEEVEYFVTATNRSFGRVQARGKKTTDVDRILDLADSRIAFERMVGSYRPVPEFRIEDINLLRPEPLKAVLSFTTKLQPHSLFIRVVRTTPFRKRLVMGELVYRNQGQFVEGSNQLEISQTASSELGRYLFRYLIEGEDVTVQLSMSGDGLGWGPIN